MTRPRSKKLSKEQIRQFEDLQDWLYDMGKDKDSPITPTGAIAKFAWKTAQKMDAIFSA